MRQIVHEVKLAGYGVTCDSPFYARGFLTIGADVGRIDQLHITTDDRWKDLTISVTFSEGALNAKALMDHDGYVVIPDVVLSRPTPLSRKGSIVFTGIAPGVRRIVVKLPYCIENIAQSEGVDSTTLFSNWPVYSVKTSGDFPEQGRTNVLYKAQNEACLYQWNADAQSYEVLSGLGSSVWPAVLVLDGGTP